MNLPSAEHELLMTEIWCAEVRILLLGVSSDDVSARNYRFFDRQISMWFNNFQASNRVAYNLQQTTSAKQLDIFSKLGKISRNVFDVGGPVQSNLLGF